MLNGLELRTIILNKIVSLCLFHTFYFIFTKSDWIFFNGCSPKNIFLATCIKNNSNCLNLENIFYSSATYYSFFVKSLFNEIAWKLIK